MLTDDIVVAALLDYMKDKPAALRDIVMREVAEAACNEAFSTAIGIARGAATSRGLHEAKSRGKELGQNGIVLAIEHMLNADDFARHVGPIIAEMRESGAIFQEIADNLNARHILTYEKCYWRTGNVHRVLKRYKQLTETL